MEEPRIYFSMEGTWTTPNTKTDCKISINKWKPMCRLRITWAQCESVCREERREWELCRGGNEGCERRRAEPVMIGRSHITPSSRVQNHCPRIFSYTQSLITLFLVGHFAQSNKPTKNKTKDKKSTLFPETFLSRQKDVSVEQVKSSEF